MQKKNCVKSILSLSMIFGLAAVCTSATDAHSLMLKTEKKLADTNSNCIKVTQAQLEQIKASRKIQPIRANTIIYTNDEKQFDEPEPKGCYRCFSYYNENGNLRCGEFYVNCNTKSTCSCR